VTRDNRAWTAGAKRYVERAQEQKHIAGTMRSEQGCHDRPHDTSLPYPDPLPPDPTLVARGILSRNASSAVHKDVSQQEHIRIAGGRGQSGSACLAKGVYGTRHPEEQWPILSAAFLISRTLLHDEQRAGRRFHSGSAKGADHRRSQHRNGLDNRAAKRLLQLRR